MPTKGVTMRKIKSILRLRYELKLSQHQIADSLGLSSGVVNKYLKRTEKLGIFWPLPRGIDSEASLRERLQPAQQSNHSIQSKHAIDFPAMHQELQRKGMTVQLLWEEYAQQSDKLLGSFIDVCWHEPTTLYAAGLSELYFKSLNARPFLNVDSAA
jgi:predicted transcriptional regulator